MSVIGALMWAIGAHLAFYWIRLLALSLREAASRDLIGAVIAQALGYLFILYLIMRVHAPESRIRDIIGLRRTNPLVYPLALVAGVGATFPSYWLLERVHDLLPSEEPELGFLDIYFQLSFAEQIAVAVGTVIIGPFVEEMLFRGAIFRPLREKYRAAVVIAITAATFAAIHEDPRKMAPLLLVGIVLGTLRWTSGSLWAPLLFHMGFNAVPFYDLFQLDALPENIDEPVAIQLVVIGAAAFTVAMAALLLVTRKSRTASAARRE